jgi:hypothetical protein
MLGFHLSRGAERLEPRMLLSISPAGSEFGANTFMTGAQATPAIAMDGDGEFVVAWQSNLQDGSTYGIYAQRYDAAGVAQGTEFRVNSFTTDSQSVPALAMDADGDFVIVWQSQNQDGNGQGIYAKRYTAAGVPQGGEFRVNVHTSANQSAPAVAVSAEGDFVITWTSFGQDGDNAGVYARRYSAAGVAQGGEFRVNTYTTSSQHFASIAMDAVGEFTIAWHSFEQDGSGYGIYAQRYSAAGVAQGDEFRANTYTTNTQRNPSIGVDADGDFVIAWHSDDQDGSDYGVYAQRYNALGVAQGGEFRANTYTTERQRGASVAMDTAGDFVIAWDSFEQDGGGRGVYAQAYNAAGVPQGAEFRVSTYTTGDQRDR